MTTRDLIKQLQRLDPAGTMTVNRIADDAASIVEVDQCVVRNLADETEDGPEEDAGHDEILLD